MTQTELSESIQSTPSTNSLARLIMDDILRFLRLKRRNLLRRILNFIGKKPSTWMAEILARYDKRIVESSFLQATHEALGLFSEGVKVNGRHKIPFEGALLVIANHPGLADALGAVWSAGREDVTIVAGKRDVLRLLPNLKRHFMELETDVNLRASATREIIRLLNDGKTVIIFPKGTVEPEPSLVGGTRESIQGWSRSIGIFLAKAPQTHLVPMLISQVLTEASWNSWLAKRFKTPKHRHQMAMAVQFVMQRISKNPIWKIPMRIDIGDVCTAPDLDNELDPKTLAEAAKQKVDRLLNATYPEIS